MSSTDNLIKSKLSADERYLQANGLKYDNGQPTVEGKIALGQYLWDKHEQDLVKELKAADKAIRAAAAADAAELVTDPE